MALFWCFRIISGGFYDSFIGLLEDNFAAIRNDILLDTDDKYFERITYRPKQVI